MDTKVTIGVACHETIKPKTLLSIGRLIAKSKHTIELVVQEGCMVSENRFRIVNKAIANSSDYLLFVDSDMYFEEDLLDRLLAHNKDIIGVDSKYRRLPLESTVRGQIQGSPCIVEAVGTGILLVKMSTFSTIKHPWFYIEMTEYGAVKTSEDYWFCKQAKEAGFDIWCDSSVKIGHLGEYNYNNYEPTD